MKLTELEKYQEIVNVSFDHEGAHLASTHELQGGASSGWNTALLLKSEDADQELIKALEQIEVSLSMEEFLQRFFNMWSDDAELLTKILGFETENEYRDRLEDDGVQAPDRWGTNESWEEYKKRNLESRADKVKFVEKANLNGIDSLTTVEKIAVLEFQSEIEKAVNFLGGFDAVIEKFKVDPENVDAGDTGDLSDEVGVEKSSTSAEGESKENPSADNEINKTSNENNEEVTLMTKKVEKTADEIQLEKMATQLETLEKALSDAKEKSDATEAQLETLEKAEADRKQAGAIKLVKSFGFIEEDKQEEVVSFMVKSTEAPLIAELLKQASEQIAEAKAEVEEVKKEFGGTEHGVEGEAAKKTEQESLDKSLESFQETLSNLAD